MSDEQIMVDLEAIKSDPKVDKWLDLAIALLKLSANWKDDGLRPYTPDEIFTAQPDLQWMGNILEMVGYLMPSAPTEGRFPYQITLKGLLFYDLISDVLVLPTLNSQNKPCERSMLRDPKTYKMLFQILHNS